MQTQLTLADHVSFEKSFLIFLYRYIFAIFFLVSEWFLRQARQVDPDLPEEDATESPEEDATDASAGADTDAGADAGSDADVVESAGAPTTTQDPLQCPQSTSGRQARLIIVPKSLTRVFSTIRLDNFVLLSAGAGML